MPRKPAPQDLMTIPAAAGLVGCHDRTIRRYIRDGRLRAYRVGPKLARVARADVEALIRPIPSAGDAA